MTSGLIQAVARGPRVPLTGVFQRHASPKNVALTGSTSGRWCPGGFPVLYLARPEAAVVAEAYRWLVDPTEGLSGDRVHNRMLLTVEVNVTDVLDLRHEDVRAAVDLTDADIYSDVNERQAYGHPRAVAEAAHQSAMHGIVVPAASGLGEALALFTRQLANSNQMSHVIETQRWETLPADPRRLRLLRPSDAAEGGN